MTDTIGTRVRQLHTRGASLNETRKDNGSNTFDKGGYNVQGTDISFTASDTIASAGNAFPTGLAAGQNIMVTGSTLNDRVWKVETVAAGTITVSPAQIQAESAGALIDIRTA